MAATTSGISVDCGGSRLPTGQSPSTATGPRAVQVTVVDEAGAPVTSAEMLAIGNTKPLAIEGTRQLKIDQPMAGTIEDSG